MALTFAEKLHAGFEQTLEVTDLLVHEQSEFQDIKIFDTVANGRVMALDDIVQISTRDEASYSEMLTHLPAFDLMAQGAPVKKVMIVGGGDAAVAEEALKHKSLDSVDMAEIDPRVIELCKEHFPGVNAAAYADARLKVHVRDAFEFLKEPTSQGAFDIIVADRPDPVGPAEILFADVFYETVAAALSPTGVAVFQTGVPFYQPDELGATIRQLGKAFKHVGTYTTVTPSYTGGIMALTWASNGSELGKADDAALAKLFAASGITTDYYTPALHNAAFKLPAWMERLTR